MNKKQLMIIGAGIYQVPLILKAREMGYSPIVVSIPGDYPGIPLADTFYNLDTRDREGILEAAQKEKITGICTSGTDVAVRSVGYVCSKMGLSGITNEAAEMVTDKWRMKEAFCNNGVSTAAFYKVTSLSEAKEAAEVIGYPVMVKATDSSGSRGIRCAHDEAALMIAYDEAVNVTQKEYVLIEEFIEATEIGVDGYVGGDGEVFLFPHEKFNYEISGTTIPVGHKFPYAADEELMRELDVQMNRAVKALHLRNCPLNADVFVKDHKVWIIEVGGRTGGTCIPELLSIYTGYNWYEKIISAAVGEPVSFEGETRTPCMAKLIFSPVEEVIRSIDTDRLDRLRKKGIECQIDYPVGHSVHVMKKGPNRIGHIVVPTSKEEELEAFLSEMRECICLENGTLEEVWRAYEEKGSNHWGK